MKHRILLLGFILTFIAQAQEYYPTNEGVKTTNNNYTAITNAKIYVSPTSIISNGTLLLKNGIVIDTGKHVKIPENSVVIDAMGFNIYPSFIDVFSTFGVSKPKRSSNSGRSPQYNPSREGYYWNDHIRAEQNAVDYFQFDEKTAKSLLTQGFGLVNTHMEDGIVRGTGSLIALDVNGNNAQRIIEKQSAQFLSFSKSVQSRQSYPTSIMGAMALLRQLYHDSDWYRKGHIESTDLSIEAFNANANLPQIIAAGSRSNALRADKIGDQFNVQYTILGGGDEYERIDDIKNTNATYIIPINFPKPYDVENNFLANRMELDLMRAWNQKPANPKILAEHNIPFALTLHGSKSPKEFRSNLAIAITHGLSETKALEALTTVPSQVLKNSKIGNLNPGSYANFTVVKGDIFKDKSTVFEHWIRGSRHIFKDINNKDIRGLYSFHVDGVSYTIDIEGQQEKIKANLKTETATYDANVTYNNQWLRLIFTSQNTDKQEFVRLHAKISKDSNLIDGTLIDANGSSEKITLTKLEKNNKKSAKKTDKNKVQTILPITYPNVAYGNVSIPKPETILFQNATVWTNETEGILQNTDVLIKNGKISAIGQNLKAHGARIINATGKHLTSGIIDEHSHIAAASINEAGQNSSAEVSIEDVIEDNDINIYRNLSGGVTTIQILHGSANPIGGQSAIIKLKWGESSENLLYKKAPKFIKFALGENVKQSNWQSFNRFPQTRMGVEQTYVDYFSRAKAYDEAKKKGKPYRIDKELEVLAEILNKERFISCHSYVQSEINMLMKVAEQFDFNINTFTHILEGYKVADKMKSHGVGGSTFSDWWAYKYEVNDAIPYNASILNNVGVVTAINSDDAEMSRRLNQEAAKTVKYGGTSEEDAWKMVTLNPAKLLHIDEYVGSIKIGKEADIVLWSDHPLSIYAKAEKTIIEGAIYFDIENDKKHRQSIQNERNTLIQMMLKQKHKGMKTQPIKITKKEDLHCDSLDDNDF